LVQTFCDCGFELWNPVRGYLRTVRGENPFRGEDVLRRIRQAVQWTEVFARANVFLSLSRLSERMLLRDRDERIELRIESFGAIQVRLRDFNRRDFPALDLSSQLAAAKKNQIAAGHRFYLTLAMKIGAGSTESSISRSRTIWNWSRFRCKAGLIAR